MYVSYVYSLRLTLECQSKIKHSYMYVTKAEESGGLLVGRDIWTIHVRQLNPISEQCNTCTIFLNSGCLSTQIWYLYLNCKSVRNLMSFKQKSIIKSYVFSNDEKSYWYPKTCNIGIIPKYFKRSKIHV